MKMEAWALVKPNTPLQKIPFDIPEPKGTEVIVKVTHCGVCHSDLHNFEGFYDLGNGKKLRLEDRTTLPVVLGHEILGTVARLGPDAKDQGVNVGDSRIIYPWIGCQKCDRCANENDHICKNAGSLGLMQKGGFSSHVVLPHPKYLLDYGQVDPTVACTFACSGLAVITAIKKIVPIDPNQFVVLIGSGGLGLQAIEMLTKGYNHQKIITIDIDDGKLEAAKRAGAPYVINSKTENALVRINEIAGGPVQNVIDLVGNSETSRMGYDALDKAAKLVLVGIAGGTFAVPSVDMIFKGTTVYGCMRGSLQNLRHVAEFGRNGKMGGLPVRTLAWDDANEALGQLGAGKVTGRLVLLHPQDG